LLLLPVRITLCRGIPPTTTTYTGNAAFHSPDPRHPHGGLPEAVGEEYGVDDGGVVRSAARLILGIFVVSPSL